MADSGYARPDLLVETGWLAEHLQDPAIRIVDMDVPESYQRAHIPGALNPRVHHYFKQPDDERFAMTPEQFQEQMESMGIGDDHLVIAYDASRSLYAARLWWLLTYFGHTNIKVLNGGWNKWLHEGRPITLQTPQFPRARFTTNVNPEVVASAEYLKARLGDENLRVWDVRTDGEWDGSNSRGNKRAGHVPGAVHREWMNTITTGEDRTFRPAGELRQMVEALGITPKREVVTY